MVTTNRQILEKMLGRRLTNNEFYKLNKLTHGEALSWAKNQAYKEGRSPGYSTTSIKNHCRIPKEDTFKVFCLYCDKSTTHIELPFIPFMDKKIKCTVCGDEQLDKFAIYTSRTRS